MKKKFWVILMAERLRGYFVLSVLKLKIHFLQVNERNAIDELLLLGQRVAKLERLRQLESHDNKITYSKCSSFKTVNGNLPLQMSDDSDAMNKILAALRTGNVLLSHANRGSKDDEAFIGMSKRSYMEVVMNGLNSNDLVDVGPISALVFQFQTPRC
ncbi:hypothetical protein C5167_002354 [Papaver somniferum]|uniref:Uncharacterized protein n=1 Tax=Papaver somniferum TaxID=3469 RepID=A0A4Y7L0A6_PAPSO|nr:hypothetical protein C5167_002354 [Papaver somniferum]